MRYRIAPNVATRTLRDAARLAFPVRHLLSPRRLDQLARASSHRERDALLLEWSRRILGALSVTVRSGGLHHVTNGPFVVAALHEGLVDVPILIERLRLPVTFVARADLDDELPTRGLLRASGQILVNPESPSSLRKILRAAAALTAQGRSIAMFPQGSVLGIETAFQAGAFATARMLDLPVLPIALWGSHRLWSHPFSADVERHVAVRLEVLPPRRLSSLDEFRYLEREMKALALSDPTIRPRRYVPTRDGLWEDYNFAIDPDFPDVADEVAGHRRLATG